MINHVDLSEVKKLGYVHASDIATDIIARFNAEEFDVATIFYNKFESVMNQIPTKLQLIPPSSKLKKALMCLCMNTNLVKLKF